MSAIQEIRSAINRLSAQDRAFLAAELFALNTEPDAEQLDESLARGLADVMKVVSDPLKTFEA